MSEPREHYTMGYGPASTAIVASRTAKRHAAFLLPHLKPGLKVLDCGCGPGSLTLGFAKIVEPGEVIGTDLEESQLDFGRNLAVQLEITNATFRQSNIYELPFEDDSFDVVFISAVLGNLREPLRGLAQARRVLKPKGVIGVKEFDHGGDLIYPDQPGLLDGVGLYHRLRRSNGHDPESGRKILGLLQRAGFRDINATATYETFSGSEVLQQVGGAFALLVNEAFAEPFQRLGWATKADVQRMTRAWQEFSQQPGAIYAQAWCEAVGFK